MGFEDKVVGSIRPFAESVEIVDYDPEWPRCYERLAARLRAALGGTLRSVAHKGSTAVPGLAAKPVIDILAEVADSAAESEYVPILERHGYHLRIREPDWYEHRMLCQRVGEGDPVSVNLHVYTEGCPEIERNLVFRDWLREHPEDRDRYAALKRELATREWRFVQDYAEAKTEFIEEIIAKARRA